ncbi:hypothetical protein F3I27_23415 [Pantoea sp. Bo_2]|uniref:hypothetical protein n=1 Tax=unclassified Pantoea TaxID=2630326 RepID=UPI0012327BF5|nr:MULTISPECIES: hypothetical protein [unclassified Pantoea]KAA5935929.1 hypothetical protein F3I57_23010 [Pantoea sp. VH_3]KAA5944890.1 hypothetical protein F3I56_23025 [Pantoea sp. VH_25]KAA5949397.1 hypothetical protein F3I55_22680 [Pantoea sp. VH_24]KAA5955318.1 hypothetical protein F3I53_20360 [Pantoea sp. VH_16]KAA5961379.1 hypothetical protein F3I54_19935 [Pantoea sp. VH_18]
MGDRPDTSKVTALLQSMISLKRAGVKVGIPKENNPRKDGLPLGNAGLMQLHEYGGDVHIPEHTVSITRRIRADGSFAYSGQFRKNGNFQTFHQVPAHTVRIPERSIFRYTFHQNDYFRKEMAVRATAVLNGTITVEEAMTLVGSRVRRKLRASFADGHLKPNEDWAIREKGGKDEPLIASRDMYESITFITDTGGTSK